MFFCLLGKSSLLNAIIRTQKGFEVSSTIEAETKGIWFLKGEFPGNPNRLKSEQIKIH